MSFDEDLDAQMNRELDTVDVPVTVNGKLRTLRFTEMDGLKWADFCDRSPARPGVLLDMRYGYNLRELTKIAAPASGVLVDGDTVTELSTEQWAKLLKGLPGSSAQRIGDALFNLNEWMPGQAVEDAKKAFAAESAKNSPSPDNSESPEADS